MRFGVIITTILGFFLLISCEKELDEPFLQKKDVKPSINKSKSNLSYGGTIFFLDKNAKKNTISPVNQPALEGYFRSIPKGLSLNKESGAVNLSESISGMSYKVYYVANDGKLIDSTRIVVSGVDYEDGIYDLGDVTGNGKKVSPFYNANKNSPAPFSINGTNADFDETDLDGDGQIDIQGANSQKLKVNRKDGTIDLLASVKDGLFGSDKPENGSTRELSVFYRVNDNSLRALNSITVKLMYFKSRADIPEDLLNTLKSRRDIEFRVNAMRGPGLTSETGITTDPLSDLTSYDKPVRPPLIIIIN